MISLRRSKILPMRCLPPNNLSVKHFMMLTYRWRHCLPHFFTFPKHTLSGFRYWKRLWQCKLQLQDDYNALHWVAKDLKKPTVKKWPHILKGGYSTQSRCFLDKCKYEYKHKNTNSELNGGAHLTAGVSLTAGTLCTGRSSWRWGISWKSVFDILVRN